VRAVYNKKNLPMLRFFLTCTVLALFIGSGVVQGVWTNRWRTSDNDRAARMGRLDQLAMTIGDWDGQPGSMETVPPDQRDCSIVRFYVNRHNASTVSIYLTYGPTGPLCFNHTPLGCYPSNGYKLAGDESKFNFPRQDTLVPANFRVAKFSKTDSPVPQHVRVFWSWSGSGAWLAPDSPRLAFAGYSGLYKLYVTRDMASPEESLENDPAIEFIRVLVPELRKTLFPDS
jgi:hypothetical protein